MDQHFYISYKCSKCGQDHTGPPSFAFDAPTFYNALTQEDKVKSLLSSDACVVLDRDFFIRVMLYVPILGTNDSFSWGVWASQSRENFIFYNEHFKEDLTGRETFGWLSSLLPDYEETLGLKTTVIFHGSRLRPHLHLEESPHQLSQDFHNGMSIERAKKVGEIMLERSIQHD